MDTMLGLFRSGGAWALVELLKGTIVLVLVWGVASSLRRASASVRHLVWSAGILAILGMPLLSVALPWRLAVLPSASVAAGPGTEEDAAAAAQHLVRGDVAAGVAEGVHSPAAPASSGGPAERSRLDPAATAPVAPALGAGREIGGRPGAPAAADGSLTGRGVGTTVTGWWRERVSRGGLLLGLMVLWAAGVLLVLVRLAVGAWLVRRIVRGATPLGTSDWTRPLFEAADRLELPRLPALLISDRMPMPFTAGALRPAIVLPAGAVEWSDRRRRAVLFHELAHVRRLDVVTNVLGRVACACYWFHPLVWVAARRMTAEGERAADDLVLTSGTRASEYADHLLQIVARAGRSTAPAVALPLAQRKEFEGRMLAILESDARRATPSRGRAFVFAGLAAALLVPVAALRPAAPAPAPAQESPRVLAGTPVPAEAATSPGATASRGRRESLATAPETRPTPDVTELADRRLDNPEAASAPTSVSRSMRVSRQFQETEATYTLKSTTTSGSAKVDQARDTTDPRVIAALVRALGDSSAEVREDAAYALGQREAATAVPELGRVLRHDASPRVREMCAWALGTIQARSAVAALAATLGSDRDASVRATAVWALGQIEDSTALPALADALADAATEVRGRAAWAIGTIEPRRAPAALARALRDAAPDVRQRAAWALGTIEDATYATALVPLLSDSAAEVRKTAAWALAQLDSEEARNGLLEALNARDPDVRARAARALAGHGASPWPWPWPQPRIR